MTTSNRLGITELAETQNNRSVTINEAIAKLEAGATCFAAISIGDTAPPGSPAEGDLYVLGSSPTGAWSGQGKHVAVYYNSTWFFLPPIEGALAYAQDADAYYFYDSSAWSLLAGGGGAGDVVGPGSAVDSNIALFNTTTGKLIKDSGVAISTVLRSDTTANLTKGFTASGYSAGTKSSGTFTPDPANGNLQYATNGGAHTLAPPSTGGGNALTMVIQYTNNGSAGTITTSGFTKVTGDALTTVNGDDFFFHITVLNGFSHLNVVALQ